EGLRPMLATSGPLPFSDAGWAYEMKWDGLRAIAYAGPEGTRLESRTGRGITHAYPELAGLRSPALTRGAPHAGPDGEIVAFGGEPWPSFEALQQRMNIATAAEALTLSAQVPVTYVAFDLLELNGHPLLTLPYAERRGLLDELGLSGPRWQAPPAFT